MKIDSQQGWCVAAPYRFQERYFLMFKTAAFLRKDAQDRAVEFWGSSWKCLYRQGFRAVRATLQPSVGDTPNEGTE